MKSWEFYAALGAAAVYVFARSKKHTLIQRTTIVAVSATLGGTLASDMASLAGLSDALAGVIVTTVSYPLLDVASALVSDRKAIVDIIRGRFK